MLKRFIVWGGIAFLVFFVAFKPGAAADAVGLIGQTFVDIFRGVGDFFRSLVD